MSDPLQRICRACKPFGGFTSSAFPTTHPVPYVGICPENDPFDRRVAEGNRSKRVDCAAEGNLANRSGEILR